MIQGQVQEQKSRSSVSETLACPKEGIEKQTKLKEQELKMRKKLLELQ